MMVRVLFVCLGNICRSPLAMAVFNQKVQERGLSDHFLIDSCGTAGYHIGELPDERTLATARHFELLLNHRARQISPRDLRSFDYVIAMDEHNHADILGLASRYGYSCEHVSLMRHYEKEGSKEKVPDPYYGEMKDFYEVYHILDRSCKGLLDYILENHKGL